METAITDITYSPSYTLVPTHECFNRCIYCNFRTDPGQEAWLSLCEAERQLQAIAPQGVIEILILSGEVHPQSDRRSAWFERIYDLCTLALNLGFLPHTNAGPLSWEEMARLKSVNVSMGLMLEQQTSRLQTTVHRHAPSKRPELRVQQLEWAGQLKIPMTTGLLLGIGETATERSESLRAIAQIHQQWGHIQEVILQPYSPGTHELWQQSALGIDDLLETITAARHILPPDITLQIPPNLIATPFHLTQCLRAGARDLGGIGPCDVVNPDYPHPIDTQLATQLKSNGWHLTPRLPIYPQYDDWLPASLQTLVHAWRSRLAQISPS